MLQRSPTYFNPGNNEDTMADELRELEIDENWIHHIVRKRLLKEQGERIGRALREPEAFAAEMIEKVREYLGPDVDIEKHFTPRYRPWQQRVAFIPYGDLFKPFREGKASIVTDHIDRFEEEGVRLTSGELIEADIIVTATGFRLCVLGDIAFKVSGKPVDFADTVTYHGMMFTGIPNLVWVFGYFRASWTLRVEIVADFVCRLFKFMDERGRKAVTVELRPEDRDMRLMPWMDPDNFNPGYLMRDIHLMPKRGEKPEWQHTQDYYKEREVLPRIDLASSFFHYS
jgi:cation diffusion facilitator CzcD-associated flavoprotein CzcO